MWDPPGPGLEPVSPALAGGLSTTRHQGSPKMTSFMFVYILLQWKVRAEVRFIFCWVHLLQYLCLGKWLVLEFQKMDLSDHNSEDERTVQPGNYTGSLWGYLIISGCDAACSDFILIQQDLPREKVPILQRTFFFKLTIGSCKITRATHIIFLLGSAAPESI